MSSGSQMRSTIVAVPDTGNTASSFEIYIHVPFCIKRCGYCDFNTYTAADLGQGASRDNYANMAIHEMRLVQQWQQAHGIEEGAVSTIFFGGGTPTLLPADDLTRMVEAVAQLWGIEKGAEITTEANPDTVDEQYLAQLVAGGFTRVSFGMQSAVPHVLATLDRTHTPANVSVNVKSAQELGLESSVDLIYGTPGESLEDWKSSVQAALDLNVAHVSAYALTLEPTTKMGRQVATGALPGPDDDDEAAKYELADSLFSQAGLEWYEISNWAKEGHESRHNLGYWRNVDWAGIGPGAHSHYNTVAFSPSHLPTGNLSVDTSWRRTGSGQQTENLPTGGFQAVNYLADSTPVALEDPHWAPVRTWDISHPRRWAEALNAGLVPWGGGEKILARENVEETVMLGLRLREGLSISQVERLTGRRFSHANLQKLADSSLATLGSGRIRATRRGRLLNDDLIATVLDMLE